MNFTWIILILLGFAFIAFPNLLQFILAFIFITMGISSLMANQIAKKMKNKDERWEYVKFGGYTIYTNKK